MQLELLDLALKDGRYGLGGVRIRTGGDRSTRRGCSAKTAPREGEKPGRNTT